MEAHLSSNRFQRCRSRSNDAECSGGIKRSSRRRRKSDLFDFISRWSLVMSFETIIGYSSIVLCSIKI